jgi:hypothetical protein
MKERQFESDEIVEEVRRARHAHAAAHGFDLRRIFDDLKKRERESGEPVVSLEPRRVGPRRGAAGR